MFFCGSWSDINPVDLNGKKHFPWMRRTLYHNWNKANHKEK